MKEVSFSKLKKESPKDAKEFVTDQELLLVFLNSPVRNEWMKFINLKDNETKKIMEIVEYYAKLKIDAEKKSKPKKREDIIKIESDCLKKIYKGEILNFKTKTEDPLTIAKKIAAKEYPDSVIINTLEAEKLATLAGLSGKEFPSELLVFDVKNKKIIGLNIINK